MKYDFGFSWQSTYGHAARLAGQYAERGLVIDLGCGAAAFEQPMTELGFEYLGFEYDPESIELCRSRGVRCEPIDLSDLNGALEQIRRSVGDQQVRIISLLDVIEHLIEPERVFAGLVSIVTALEHDGAQPLLLVSIPNVAHADLGAKLVGGRWDVTGTGLLDDTHVTLFTEERVLALMDEYGFEEVGRDDTVIAVTEQRFPDDHPMVGDATPVSEYLRHLRRSANDSADTYQFVRCYRHRRVAPDRDLTEVTRPAISVVLRTAGRVPDLVESLTCIAAQADRDMQVVVAVETDDETVLAGVVDAVAMFPSDFAGSVDVIATAGASSAAAYNAALGRVTGRRVVFLDDAYLLHATWATELAGAMSEANGRTIRMPVSTQAHERNRSTGRLEPVGAFDEGDRAPFDLLGHFAEDRTPVGTLAVPAAALEALRLGFDEDVAPAASEWAFVLRVAMSTGMLDHPQAMGIRRIAAGAQPTASPVDLRAEVLGTFDAAPLLLPAGGATAMLEVLERAEERDEIERQYRAATDAVNAFQRSRWWRLTAPARWLSTRVRAEQ